MSERDELKPCPFCGSENVEPQYAGCGDWYVMCGSCATEGPWGETSKDSAIAAWNRRDGAQS